MLTCVMAVTALPRLAHAVYTVDSTADEIDDDVLDGICHTASDSCTLRAAVMQASRHADQVAYIVLPPGRYVLTRVPESTPDETNGDLDFLFAVAGVRKIFLTGDSSATTIIDANQIDRAMSLAPGRTLVINKVTLLHGMTTGNGGAIVNDRGTLTINDSRIQEGSADGVGGAIYSTGTLNLFRCELVDNQAYQGGALYLGDPVGGPPGATQVSQSRLLGNHAHVGGGIAVHASTQVDRSEISGNTAGLGGGGAYVFATFTMTNSTIAANGSNINGGGIYYVTTLPTNIYNSTIVGNGADEDQDFQGSGGGIYQASSFGQFNLYNTIVAGNYVSNAPLPDDCKGVIKTHARNRFGTIAGCTIDQISGSWDYLNSLGFLGPLQNNGGPTRTIALLAGSNAIDAGTPGVGCLDINSTTIAADQRGFPRNVGVCDLGAFEFGVVDQTGAWEFAAAYPIPIYDQALASVGNTLFSFSGVSYGEYTSSSYRFDGSSWARIADLPVAVELASAASDGRYLYVIGGINGTGIGESYRYDPDTNSYAGLAPAPTATWASATVYVDGKVYKMGGSTGGNGPTTSSVEAYDVTSGQWDSVAPCPLALGFASAFAYNHFIYVAGGFSFETLTASLEAYRYDPAANVWDDASFADLPAARWGAAVSQLPEGAVLAGGNLGGAAASSATALQWSAQTNSWRALPDMLESRARASGGVVRGCFVAVGGSPGGGDLSGTRENQKLDCIFSDGFQPQSSFPDSQAR
jgi:hypothetical protein